MALRPCAAAPGPAAPGARFAVRGAADRPVRAAWRGLARAPVIRATAGILTAIAIAWYLYGPPWYLSGPGASGIGFQEDVFLNGFQAISKGAVPYVGPASVQYGPGAQLLSYLYMRHIGTFLGGRLP